MMQTIRSNPGVKGYTLLEMMIVVAVIGVLITMARPSFRRMINNMQVERFVQQLQMEEQAFRQFAIFNRGYPPTAAPHELPPGLQGYLPAGFNWTNATPLGGNWKWDGTDPDGMQGGRNRGFFFEYGITISTVYTPLWASNLFQEVDRRIDDGNLNTGIFRKNNQAINVYSYSLQYDTKKPWGTAQ